MLTTGEGIAVAGCAASAAYVLVNAMQLLAKHRVAKEVNAAVDKFVSGVAGLVALFKAADTDTK